jgi:hypothetical protein
MRFNDILRLTETARSLTALVPPGAGKEYIRGQVELICAVSGIPFALDVIGNALTKYIARESDKLIEDELWAIVLSELSDN